MKQTMEEKAARRQEEQEKEALERIPLAEKLELARDVLQGADRQLLKALANLYPDTEPVEVAALCEAVVALFKATEDIKNLAADVAIHFPPDFLDATDAGPVAVKKSFVHAKKNPLGDK